MFACHVFTTATVDGVHKFVCLASPPQVALIDVNESAGRSLVGVLEKEFGPDRVLFLSCDVESEEKLKGLILSSSLRHNHKSVKPESQIQIHQLRQRKITKNRPYSIFQIYGLIL